MTAAATMSATRRAELILHEVETLPTLPSVAMRLMRITSAEDADLKEIIRLIEADPPLAAKVLSMCRRAELGLGARVTTVERAVVLLGLEMLKSIVLGVQVMDWSSTHAERGSQPGAAGTKPGTFDREGFWRHCISVACGAEMIAAKHRELEVQPGEAFVAGLLHDLGKVALQMVLPQAYAQVIEMADTRSANIADIEAQVIGLDHHTAGKRLAERWQLPTVLTEAIWLHGQRCEALPPGPNRKLVGIVRTADALCRRLHLGWSGNHTMPESTAELCRSAGLHPQRVDALSAPLLEAVSERCADLGLGDAPSEQMVVDALASANRQLSRLNTTIERRTKDSASRAKVLDGVSEFLSRAKPALGVVETVTEVARSVSKMFGEGTSVVVYDTGRVAMNGRPSQNDERPYSMWIVLEFDGSGNRLASDVIDRPEVGAGDATNRFAEVALRTVESVRSVLNRPGAAVLNLLPASVIGHDEAGVVMVHDREDAVRALGRKQVGALLTAWGSALGAAIREEAGSRLGEQLAEANRVLADMQRELSESQSMARLAELTAGAAHEFNNPLAVISGRAQLMAGTVVDPKHKAAVASIVQGARQLSDLVQRLHVIARPPVPTFDRTTVSDVLSEAVKRAVLRAPRKNAQGVPTEIRVSVPSNLPAARLDREQITQAMTEVLANALEADPRDFVDVRVQIDALDDRLLVQVTDTGRGMSEHAVRHALDPFFSHKTAGRQPGLGLTLAHRLIQLHGGTIRIESEPEDGTIVSIALKDWRWDTAAGTRGANNGM